ncbi:preprotein translocase subunit YajC [Propionispora hippei]|uniref:preprotein translocase subunit YajC n=1 Tax=Propionispora hippei TaxID=209080 RepID=UPI00292F1A90|nr:preprotein translocase subunit YajC [Propionispora hippei]
MIFLPGITQEIMQYAPLIVMIVIFYFFLYRPQKKRQQQRNQMLDSLKKGDRIVTVGGLHGTIVALNERVVTLKIAEKVDVTVSRSSVNGLQSELKNNEK